MALLRTYKSVCYINFRTSPQFPCVLEVFFSFFQFFSTCQESYAPSQCFTPDGMSTAREFSFDQFSRKCK